MPNEQRIIYFSGRVQGVGFRYITSRTAGGFDITGYVRNLVDGRVECVAEGDTKEIDLFLRDLADQMGGYIHNTTQSKAPAAGGFGTFEIRY